MKSFWIVVAESARARIFAVSGTGGKLSEIADLSHPESRLHASDLSSDLPGRTFDSRGQGRHRMEQPTDLKTQEAQAFAAEIIRYLDHGRGEGAFDALVLAASPTFLGLLRSKLSKATRNTIVGEINKNLVEADQKTLEQQVSAFIK